MIPLTETAHQLVRSVIRAGDVAIDATVGNGFDTLFLAECVGPGGIVYGFDIQTAALSVAANRLAAAKLSNVMLLPRSHAEIVDAVSTAHRSRVAAVMLNLGYLPGGDKRLTTLAESSIEAIRGGLTLLAPGGIMTVLAYTGHQGGAAEAAAVEALLNDLPRTEFQFSEASPVTDRSAAPRLFAVRKLSNFAT